MEESIKFFKFSAYKDRSFKFGNHEIMNFEVWVWGNSRVRVFHLWKKWSERIKKMKLYISRTIWTKKAQCLCLVTLINIILVYFIHLFFLHRRNDKSLETHIHKMKELRFELRSYCLTLKIWFYKQIKIIIQDIIII
jgi:hypothetical protein